MNIVSLLAINLISALAISIVITCMVAVKDQRAKSVILVLPIPITIALLATGGRATSLSILGLALINCFIWGVYVLYNKNWNILLADVLAAVLYVVFAYLITKTIHPTFLVVAVLYLLGWLLLIYKIKKLKLPKVTPASRTAPLPVRSGIIFVIAYLLFTFKQYLAAFVVTFPYNTIFGVYENRQNLLVQAALFTRNSIALWAYFVANYYLTLSGANWYAYVGSWTAFGIVMILVSKFFPLVILKNDHIITKEAL